VLFEGPPEDLALADTPTSRFMREELDRTQYDADEGLGRDEALNLDTMASEGDDDADDVDADEEPEAEEA
jgi:hypothetical protein